MLQWEPNHDSGWFSSLMTAGWEAQTAAHANRTPIVQDVRRSVGPFERIDVRRQCDREMSALAAA